MPDQKPLSKSRWVPWSLGAAVALGIGAGAIWWPPFVKNAPVVAVETISARPTTRVLAVNGQVAAQTSVEVRSAVTGSLQGDLVAVGTTVQAGTVLARIDSRQQQAVVKQAQSALDQGLLVQSQAAADYARLRDLNGVASRSALEDAQLTLAGTAQSVEALRAQVEQAQIQLDRYRITAPIAGTILQDDVDPGQYIDPSTALFTLSDLTALVVQANVDEAYATQITLGQTALLQLVGSTETLPGKVSFVSPQVDGATGSLTVKITPDERLQAPVGLTVTANIVVEDNPSALTIPRAAMVSGPAVFVVTSGKVHKTAVTVIDWPAARLIVTKGLSAGDVIVANAVGVTDGQAVKVNP